MKKFLSLLLAVMMIATLCMLSACEPTDGGDDTGEGTNDGTQGNDKGTEAPGDDGTQAPDEGDDGDDDDGDDEDITAAYNEMAAGENVLLLPEDVVDLGEQHCANWESMYAVMDGGYPTESYHASSGETSGAYGDWGQMQDSSNPVEDPNAYPLGFVWAHEVTVDGVGIFFWSDKAADRTEARTAWLSDGTGTDFPASYKIQYLNADGEWTDVEDAQGLGVEQDVMNKTTFKAVTTTELRIVITKLSPEEIVTVFGEGAEPTASDLDPFGIGIFEVEVYKAA